jgi:hypothetical protein
MENNMTQDHPGNCLPSLVRRLAELAQHSHFNCEEDTWYSCPLSIGGCSDDNKPKNKCDCGADEHNAEADAIEKQIESLLCDLATANTTD